MSNRVGVWVIAVMVASTAAVLPAFAAVRDVRVGNFYYDTNGVRDPETPITVQAGDQLRFVLEDNGPGTPHTVEIDAYGVSSGPLRQGETFTTPPLDRPGAYRIYCKPHENRGHWRRLVVEGEAPPPPPSPSSSPSPTPQPSASRSPGPSPTTAPPPPPPASPPSTSSPSPTAGPSGSTTPSPGSSPTATEQVPATADGGDPEQTPSDDASPPGSSPGTSEEDLAPDTGGDRTSGEPVAVGRGTVEPGELAGGSGDWRRVIPWAAALLLPLLATAAAALVLGRRHGTPDDS